MKQSMSRVEFMHLNEKVDKILVVVSTKQSPQEQYVVSYELNLLVNRVSRFEVMEKVMDQCVLLCFQEGIKELDESRLKDQGEMIKQCEDIVQGMGVVRTKIDDNMKIFTKDMGELITECHRAYETV